MSLSAKQREILRFPYTGKSALICDGAVRSGKTSIMVFSFVLWGMGNFSNQNFAICGKTVGSVERNIITPLLGVRYFEQNGFALNYSRSDRLLTVTRGNKVNRFYVFGGRDESSYTLIQGITLAGVLLDEVALMPRSFVDQALARCSVEGSKFWFNCNPESSTHWFYNEWILQADALDAEYLHFTMDDNPALSEETKDRYKKAFKGLFYQRYILGLWVPADGIIYDCFDDSINTYETGEGVLPAKCAEGDVPAYYGCDYGVVNPQVFLKAYILRKAGKPPKIYIDDEYYYDSKKKQRQKSNAQYVNDWKKFNAGRRYVGVAIDPSATGLIVAMRQSSVVVREAKNEVNKGIELVYTLMAEGNILINRSRCPNLIKELKSYSWDGKKELNGDEKPIKQNDHACDALRYIVNTYLSAAEVYPQLGMERD